MRPQICCPFLGKTWLGVWLPGFENVSLTPWNNSYSFAWKRPENQTCEAAPGCDFFPQSELWEPTSQGIFLKADPYLCLKKELGLNLIGITCYHALWNHSWSFGAQCEGMISRSMGQKADLHLHTSPAACSVTLYNSVIESGISIPLWKIREEASLHQVRAGFPRDMGPASGLPTLPLPAPSHTTAWHLCLPGAHGEQRPDQGKSSLTWQFPRV